MIVRYDLDEDVQVFLAEALRTRDVDTVHAYEAGRAAMTMRRSWRLQPSSNSPCVLRAATASCDLGPVEYRHGPHTTFRIDYHFVWITKYRYKALTGDVAERLSLGVEHPPEGHGRRGTARRVAHPRGQLARLDSQRVATARRRSRGREGVERVDALGRLRAVEGCQASVEVEVRHGGRG